MFASEQIPGSPDIQILHGDIESAAQIGKSFDSSQTPAGIIRNGYHRRHYQIAERLGIGPSHPSPELMKVAQTEVLRLIYNNSIGIGNIDSVLDNTGSYQYIIIARHKIEYPVFQFLRLHLPVSDARLYSGANPFQDILYRQNVFHPIMNEIHLAAPFHFKINYISYRFFIKIDDFRLYRKPVRRRGIDNRKIPGSQQRKL